MSPATPRPPRTSWQKPWVVAIVAPSKPANARARRSRRPHLLGSAGASSATTSSSSARRGAPRGRAREPALDRDEPLAHASRSSPVAMRVNVTSSMLSSGVPSAT